MSDLREEIFRYEGSPITFQQGDSVMVNATEMAKPFGKRASHWLNNQQTKEFINALSGVRILTPSDLVRVTNGDKGGTWMHEDVALEFARWLSPTFAIWCNDRIKELLTQGVATVSNDDEVIAQAMTVLQRRLEANKQQLQIAQGTIEAQQEELKAIAPLADYTREVLQSTSTFTATQIAKDLGMSAVTLNSKLRRLGVQFYQSGQWFLTAKYQGRGYTDMRIAKYVDSRTDEVKTSQSLVWTERGRLFINALSKEGRL